MNDAKLKEFFDECSGSRLREILKVLVKSYSEHEGSHLRLLELAFISSIEKNYGLKVPVEVDFDEPSIQLEAKCHDREALERFFAQVKEFMREFDKGLEVKVVTKDGVISE